MNPRTFTIQEISRKTNINTHTLRFWEKALDGIIIPLRSVGGQRRYTAEHLFIIEEIIRLKETGLRLADIKARLQDRPDKANTEDEKSDETLLLANRIAELVRSAIYRYLQEINHKITIPHDT